MFEYVKPHAEIISFLAKETIATTTTEEDDNVIQLPGQGDDLSFGESIEDGWA